MRYLLRLLVSISLVALTIVGFGIWLAFFSERPTNQTDPATLSGNGSTLNYCQLPVLDGKGIMAIDIPKGNTPGCRYDHFPLPILAACTEPLPAHVTDLRGLWQAESGRVGHVERIEQCGSRTVVTAAGVIHDYGPNSTGGLNTNDTEGRVIFSIGEKEYCPRTSASMIWNEGVLDFHVFGWGPVVVRRYLEGDQLVWEYADGTITKMNRICQLPENHRVPEPR